MMAGWMIEMLLKLN